MFYVYVLYSSKYKKTYCGFTSDLEGRLAAHNGLAHKGWAVKYGPWMIIHKEVFETKKEAMERELVLKSGKGRDFIKMILAKWVEGSYPPRRT